MERPAARILKFIFVVGLFHSCRSTNWLDASKTALLDLRGSIYDNSKSDIIFLLDTSGSLSNHDFGKEKKFIENMLNPIAVGFEATRVEVVPFGHEAYSYVKFISDPKYDLSNKCYFNEIFGVLRHANGWATNMKGAFQIAYDVCILNGHKRVPLKTVKTVIILLTDGYWNYPYGNASPVGIAQDLIRKGVEIFAFGVGWGIDIQNLNSIVANQPSGKNYAFHLKNFNEFNQLATYIRGDPYEKVWQTKQVSPSKCVPACDPQARCACGLVYGGYKCACPPGYAGTGAKGDCRKCPHGTYKGFEGYALECTACPKFSTHMLFGQISIRHCACQDGYEGQPQNGYDCTILRCPLLPAPPNGKIVGGSCDQEYGKKCTVECNEGYKLLGSATRNCVFFSSPSRHVNWDGTPAQCPLITCPGIIVNNAKKPGGDCKLPNGSPSTNYEYNTTCTYECERGYRFTGDMSRRCLINGEWSGTQPTCHEVRCEKLPPVAVGEYVGPASCGVSESKFDTVCTHKCPSGYHVHPGSTVEVTNSRQCKPDTGKWDGQQKTCVDHQPPELKCPTESVPYGNDKGKKTATVTWSFSYDDNSLRVGETSRSDFKVVLLINQKETDPVLPKMLELGKNRLYYNVTDPAGNFRTCAFTIEVEDREPPTCSFCPSDIIKEDLTGSQYRPNWDNPVCSDNSGIPPDINPSRGKTDPLQIPGTYSVKYTIKDKADNSYDNCSFVIKLMKKECKKPVPPKNGSAQCYPFGATLSCQIACMRPNDFTKPPAVAYWCSDGNWQKYPGDGQPALPLPDCSRRANPNKAGMTARPEFYFTGNCNDPNVKAQLKKNFIAVIKSPMVLPFLCLVNPACTEDKIEVYCGEIDASTRRRKRANTKKVSFKVNSVETSSTITPGSDDEKEIDLYNQLKTKVDGEKVKTESSLNNVDWNAFKVNTGLDLGGGGEKFKLKVDAYCSEDGSVVRKCPKSDLLYKSQCNQKLETAEVTKCIRCPVGTYYDKGKEDCSVCSEGHYMNEEGAFQCNRCPEGTWTFGNHKENFTSCQDECGPGYHSPTGIARCFPCPAGTYSDGKRNKACTTCPAGTTSIASGSKMLEDCGMQCAPGTYSYNGVEPCQPCPAGTYQNGTGQIACLPCPGRLSTYGSGADNVGSCTEVNNCVSNPCNFKGTCIDTKESYRCECLPGFLGTNCENIINACANKPCFGGATCVNKVLQSLKADGYICLCPPNYQGAQCDQPIKVCDTHNPCVRGKCLEKASGAQCECPQGYEGQFCEINVDECAKHPCKNNAVCIGGIDEVKCICKPGFSGQFCQINDDDCGFSNPCKNGGTCKDGERSYTCACLPGYTGAHCEAEVQECQAEPCQNGGKCTKMFNGYDCACRPGYSGRNCEKALSSDYDISFRERVTRANARPNKNIQDLTAFTISLWVRTDDQLPGTALSYAVKDPSTSMIQDNALALQDLGGLNLFINNQTAFLGLDIIDGFWHHVAVTWQNSNGAWKAYLDGALAYSSSEAFQQGEVIRGGGVMIVGQEQDELGGGFNTQESYIGDMSQLNIWSRVFSANEIYNLANSCDGNKGDVISWADFREALSGAYTITSTSYACKFDNILRYVTQYSNVSIPGHNNKITSSTNPEACATQCDQETGFLCRTFDFDKKLKKCYFSTKHSADKLAQLDTTATYDHYEMNCQRATGVESSNTLSDDKMSASSEFDSQHSAKGGRLNYKKNADANGNTIHVGAWCAKYLNPYQWLQVRYDHVMRISGVTTQGRSDYGQWVTSYKLQYSLDNSHWTTYPDTLTGNSDQNTIKRNEVRVFRAKYVRFLPQSWHGHISMRAEIYGCPDRKVYPTDNVNECSSSPCQNGGTCLNKLSAYECLCKMGYLGPNCATAAACEDPGTPVYGSKSSSNYQSGSTISFSCRSGYAIVGSSQRTCQAGKWSGTQPRCEDNNECNGNHGCAQLCINTPGSFHCACAKGYSQSGKSCSDINECAINNGGCSFSCYNKNGGLTCSLPSNMAYLIGERSCRDIDECAKDNGGCQHSCVNTYRAHKCLCNRGFQLNSNGKNCDPLSCPSLSTSLSNGVVTVKSNLVGAIATYKCINGYRLQGSKSRECQADTTWSGFHVQCDRVYCREIGTVKNAARQLLSYMNGRPVVGSIARFICNAHHVMQGSRDLVCQADGSWSGDLPRCIPAFCSQLQAPTHGQIRGYRFELGATLRVTCDVGYNLLPSSSSFRTCQKTASGAGAWSGTDPTCQLADCGDPGNPFGGSRHLDSGTKYQAVVRYTCQAQHHLQGETTQTCQADGKWGGSKPVCLKHSCGYLDAPANGQKSGNEHTYGKSVSFTCYVGYTLVGSATRTCQNNGQWTGTHPVCQIVSCGDPGTPMHGQRLGDKLTYRSMLQFECSPGYKLTGALTRECQADGTWSGSQPSCVATSCGTHLTGPSGTIQSPNYPNNYGNNEYCTWQITVPVNKKVRLDFEAFALDTADYLIIYDTGSFQPIVVFTGTQPFPFTSSGRSVRVRFISNGQTTRNGFRINYKQVEPWCGGTFTAAEGEFTSPNFPNIYDAKGFNLDCMWLIARPSHTVELAFLEFDTESNYDSIYVYQGLINNENAVIANAYDGLGTPTYPFVGKSYVWLRFKTNYITTDGNHKGWHAKWYKYNPYFVPKKKK